MKLPWLKVKSQVLVLQIFSSRSQVFNLQLIGSSFGSYSTYHKIHKCEVAIIVSATFFGEKMYAGQKSERIFIVIHIKSLFLFCVCALLRKYNRFSCKYSSPFLRWKGHSVATEYGSESTQKSDNI